MDFILLILLLLFVNFSCKLLFHFVKESHYKVKVRLDFLSLAVDFLLILMVAVFVRTLWIFV